MGNQKPERMYKLFTGHWIDLEQVLIVSEPFIRHQGTLPIFCFEIELSNEGSKTFQLSGTLKEIDYDSTDSYVTWILSNYPDKYPNCSTKQDMLDCEKIQEEEEFKSFQQKYNSFIEDLNRYKNK